MKKSLVVIALVVAALCSLFVFSVSASEQENIHISSTEFQVRQGDEFTTTIYITETANIAGIEMQLSYDTDNLTLINYSDIDATVNILDDKICLTYSQATNTTKKVELIELTFKVDENLAAGTYDIIKLDSTGNNIAKRVGTNGIVENVDLHCDFAELHIYEIGDVNFDNIVDIGDAVYIRRHLAKLHTFSEFQLIFANTQNDSIVDIADAIILQRKLAKQEVDNYGDRINVLFCNTDGEILTKKSVKIGADLNTVPDIPLLSGYTNGRWSLSKTEYVAPDYTDLTSELTVYAIYEKSISPYMQYYMSQVNNIVNQYNGVITSDWTLPTNLVYASNTEYTGTIDWSSSDANVFSNTGVFNEQTYDKTITLTAKIYSYLGSTTPESYETLTFTLLAKGAYSTPTKSEIVNYLKNITNGTLSGTNTISGGQIDCDLNLIRKISNEQVGSTSGSVYEVRIEWVINNNGVYEPISQIKREASAKTIDLVATITFNGEPLEDDGKVYFDDVSLTAITEDEICRYVIGEIASKVENSFSNGDALWADEDNYGCEIKWISKDINTVVIEQNTVTVNEQAINGTTCPITVQVTYPTDAGSNSFDLEYVITVENPNNTLLRPGVNISDSLYYALMIEMRDRFGYTQLTTEALKNTKFVSLDLSIYNDWFEDGAGELHAPITDLTGLTYCENLRLLNISGLNITSGVSEIAGLTYLESFIANNVGISSEAVGGTPILSNMINLKLVDLSSNNLTSLDMFFSSDDIYSKLKELYLDNNILSDISLLSQTPMLTLLTLSNNDIDSDDIAVLADKVYLTYLSLNNNNISSISSLNKLTALTELRLHCNNISDITALKNMTAMTKLYLGDNSIYNIGSLEQLTLLEVLYLNDNAGINDISALADMTAMQVLNISNCSINQIISLQSMTLLKELYAENNEITGFSTLSKFTNMEKLLLAGNERSGQALEWNKYLGGMANLKVLTLSGLDVSDLSFLETTTTDSTQATTTTIKPLERLEIANCAIQSEYINEDGSSVDNLEMIKKLELTLKYLDISDNPIDKNITKLGYLSSLELLYADNIDIGEDGEDIVGLMASSQSMKYLSLENCNISNMFNNSGKPWLSTSGKYVFVDLAQNPIGTFDFAYVSNSVSTLNKLYLDTTSESAYLNLTDDFYNNVLECVSLEGYYIDNVNLIPNMPQIKVLNLRNTDLNNFIGDADANGDYLYSLERFATLEYLNVAQSEVNIFTKANLEMLYANYADIYVNLYADSGKYAVPTGYTIDGVLNAEKEATKILSFIDNMVDEVKVATEGISKNNPALILDKGGYKIAWQVSDTTHYSVSSGKLALINIANIKDDTLTLTATIDSVYGVTNVSSKSFNVKTDILRLSNDYIGSDNSGASNGLMRGEEFTYDFKVIANNNENFDSKVTPVNYIVTYTYSAKAADGTSIDKSTVLEIVSESGHKYKIKNNAPLGATVTIKVTISCADDPTNNVAKELTVKVVPQTYTLTFVPNGGTVTNAEKYTVTYLTQEEETALMYSQSRKGYTFDGWYLDEQFNTKFTAEAMPSKDTTIYAKWKVNSYIVTFDAKGGSVSPTTKTVTYDATYGELPTPTRIGYTFNGWKLNGSLVTANTKVSTDQNHTLEADWTVVTYTISYNLNDGNYINGATYSKSYTVASLPTISNLTYPIYPEYNHFVGWYEDAALTKPFNPNTLTTSPRNLNLYAKWDLCTVYTEMDRTGSLEGRVIVDWRNQPTAFTDTNYPRLDINGGNNYEIIFIGDPNKTYTGFHIRFGGFYGYETLTIRLVNFKFTSNDTIAIGDYNEKGVHVILDITGECSIGTSVTAGKIIYLPNSQLDITGGGTLTMTAGSGFSGTGDGGNGGTGGTAIVAKTVNVNMDNTAGGTLNVTGGTGGTGAKGYNGDGGDRGETGHKGGVGGTGGIAISATNVSLNSGTVSINGGTGGTGGRGGEGDEGFAIFDKDGNGGNGGAGGTGGCGISAENIDVTSSSINGSIKGGNGGTGGHGGNGGSGGANESKGGSGGSGGAGGAGASSLSSSPNAKITISNGSTGDKGGNGSGT